MADEQQAVGPSDWALSWYVAEVERQATYGLAARDSLAAAITAGDVDAVLRSLQALLASIVALRRLLLPNRQASRPGQVPTERGQQLQEFARTRGRRLRRALHIKPETSPLAQDRLRNVLEHLDEYIDEWFYDGNTIVIDGIVTNSENVVIVDGKPPTMLRKYNTETHVASILGTSVEIGPLVLEMRRLQEDARAWSSQQRT